MIEGKILAKRGPKRTRPRIEDLNRVSVQGIVTERDAGSYRCRNGKYLEIVAENVQDRWCLVFYEMFSTTIMPGAMYPIFERQLLGRIKGKVHPDRRWLYVVRDPFGNYCRFLYVDPVNMRLGSRQELNAIYTSQALAPKDRPFWREFQKIKKKARRG